MVFLERGPCGEVGQKLNLSGLFCGDKKVAFRVLFQELGSRVISLRSQMGRD